jgi:signal peptidase I
MATPSTSGKNDKKKVSKKATERPTKRVSTPEQEASRQQARHWAKEWLDAFVFALIVAIIMRTFLFGSYRIPTPSMEDTLMTGDFLMVSKVAYGARTPMTLGIPLTQITIPGVSLPWVRLPGFSEVKRNDIFVFNYPIEVGPISAKTNYIKRAVGVPGDTLEIRDKILYVNGEPEETIETLRRHHLVYARDRIRLSPSKVAEAGGEILQSDGESLYLINLTPGGASTIEGWPEVDSVRQFVLPQEVNEFQQRPFSFSKGFQNHDHMSPIVVPFSGQVIELQESTWSLYQEIVTRHEKNDVEIRDGQFFLNGQPAQTYTIQQDYYFAMGDNRDDSEDSRFWGFVPYDHVVGKAWLIYFSWDKNRNLPRFDRIFSTIHD